MVRQGRPRNCLAFALSLGVVDRIGTVTANSSFFTFGGDHPEDLLDTPFAAYTASLAGKASINRCRRDKSSVMSKAQWNNSPKK
jgi:hypothetical protein